MTYEEYIASAGWQFKRALRLASDGYRCRLCDEDGSRCALHVHHRPSSYTRIPNESAEDDLITVCERCHDLITNAIREDRYGARQAPQPEIVETNIQIREEISHGMEHRSVQIDIVRPADNAQRADCRPPQQVVEDAETDFVQEQKDRRRP